MVKTIALVLKKKILIWNYDAGNQFYKEFL